MRLKFLKGRGISVNLADDFIVVNFGDPTKPPEFTAKFTPEADLPDKWAERLLSNPSYAGMFVAIETPIKSRITGSFKCDNCEFAARSKAGLAAHKRSHKEK